MMWTRLPPDRRDRQLMRSAFSLVHAFLEQPMKAQQTHSREVN
jgi:hypothetical protein